MTLTSGQLDEIATGVRRLVARNPGFMTGPGTNTYLVGTQHCAVIDPGPHDLVHIERIVEAVGSRLTAILATHTHPDHSPAVATLAHFTGAEVLGRAAPVHGRQDATFAPTRTLNDGDVVRIGELRLRAVHTPGHASNHLCYLLEETRMLFTGDHVMQGSTVVINPPDGDMRAYLRSLERLLDEDVAIIAPGHGYLIGAPHKELRRLLAHRLAREEKVVAALVKIGPASVDELLPLVYDDVPARIHRVAARSLTAHLEKLAAEGSVHTSGERYALVQSRSGTDNGH